MGKYQGLEPHLLLVWSIYVWRARPHHTCYIHTHMGPKQVFYANFSLRNWHLENEISATLGIIWLCFSFLYAILVYFIFILFFVCLFSSWVFLFYKYYILCIEGRLRLSTFWLWIKRILEGLKKNQKNGTKKYGRKFISSSSSKSRAKCECKCESCSSIGKPEDIG